MTLRHTGGGGKEEGAGGGHRSGGAGLREGSLPDCQEGSRHRCRCCSEEGPFPSPHVPFIITATSTAATVATTAALKPICPCKRGASGDFGLGITARLSSIVKLSPDFVQPAGRVQHMHRANLLATAMIPHDMCPRLIAKIRAACAPKLRRC